MQLEELMGWTDARVCYIQWRSILRPIQRPLLGHITWHQVQEGSEPLTLALTALALIEYMTESAISASFHSSFNLFDVYKTRHFYGCNIPSSGNIRDLVDHFIRISPNYSLIYCDCLEFEESLMEFQIKGGPVEFFCKPTNAILTFSVSRQIISCISLRSNKHVALPST